MHGRFISSLINRSMLKTSLWTDWAAFIGGPFVFQNTFKSPVAYHALLPALRLDPGHGHL